VTAQQTADVVKLVSSLGANAVVRASSPPFNTRFAGSVPVPDSWQHVNDDTFFGVRAQRTVDALFRAYGIGSSVFGVPTEFTMTEEIRRRAETVLHRLLPRLAGDTTMLERYLQDVACLDDDTVISDAAQWQAFLTEHGIPADWPGKLHVNDVLGLFGVSLQSPHTLVDAAVHKELRWLSRMVHGYSLRGCTADIGNMLRAGCTTDWVPDVLVLDLEFDDLVVWYVLRALNPQLRVYGQLPAGDAFTAIPRLPVFHNENVYWFTDPQSGNGDTLMTQFHLQNQ